MTAYLIVDTDLTRPERYEDSKRQAKPLAEQYGGEYLVRFCAVALQSVQSGYARIPTSLDDSSRMLGVTGWGLLRQVHAPLLKRTTVAALLLVFVDVMKELPATMVLRPFNSDTLAVVAYQLARDERLGEAALPSLALVLVGLIPVVLLSRTLGRQQD